MFSVNEGEKAKRTRARKEEGKGGSLAANRRVNAEIKGEVTRSAKSEEDEWAESHGDCCMFSTQICQ